MDAIEHKKGKTSHLEEKVILVAEDEESNYLFLKHFLENYKVIVLRAEDGIETIRKVRENPKIEMILMDIRMPQMNGIEALKRIRKLRKDLPVIAQTAYAIEEEVKEIRSMGFDEIVTKPIHTVELINKMEMALNGNSH